MQSVTVELSDELAARLRQRVADGRYSSESDAIRDGLETVLDDDPVFEDWLRQEVVPVYDRVMAGDSDGYTADEVRAALFGDGAKVDTGR